MSDKPTILTKRRSHDAANERAAWIILGDVEKYGGEGSAQVQWARLAASHKSGTCDRPRCREHEEKEA